MDGNASVFASPGLSAGSFLHSPFARGKEPDVQVGLGLGLGLELGLGLGLGLRLGLGSPN